MAIKKTITNEEWEEARRKDREWEANKITKICENCGQYFDTVHYDEPCCCPWCKEQLERKANRRAKFKQINGTRKRPPQAKNDESKHRAATELLMHGYIPYVAAVTTGEEDIHIYSGEEKILKIKVKTAHYHEKNGEVYEPSKIDKERFDHLALVFADKILFSPPLPGDLEEEKEGSIEEEKEQEKEGEKEGEKGNQKEGKNIEEDNH